MDRITDACKNITLATTSLRPVKMSQIPGCIPNHPHAKHPNWLQGRELDQNVIVLRHLATLCLEPVIYSGASKSRSNIALWSGQLPSRGFGIFNVTRSIYVTSACSSFLTAGHQTKEFDQISIIMGISSPRDQL